jgi:sigma-B regulation protein RsbU (phosphoserine phosphatase)
MNDSIARRALEARFATLVYLTLWPDGRLVYSNAGHQPPIFLTTRGECHRLTVGGAILGTFADATFEQQELTMQAGDSLVIFSDGVTEARNAADEELGEERLLSILQAARGSSPAAMLDRIFAGVKAFSGDAPPADDITAAVIHRC